MMTERMKVNAKPNLIQSNARLIEKQLRVEMEVLISSSEEDHQTVEEREQSQEDKY
jgi:hypothetical protein